jgi:hypothetical protein
MICKAEPSRAILRLRACWASASSAGGTSARASRCSFSISCRSRFRSAGVKPRRALALSRMNPSATWFAMAGALPPMKFATAGDYMRDAVIADAARSAPRWVVIEGAAPE